MKQLTPTEKDVFLEISNIGLAKAADALATITKTKVLIKFINMPNLGTKFKISDNSSPYYVLTTDIMGEKKGTCVLVLSENDKSTLCQLGFGIEESKINQNDVEAFLLELDNIISASVITQFANILKMSIFGNVPKLQVMKDASNAEQYLNGLSDIYHPLIINTHFKFGNFDIQPLFVWYFNQEFIDKIQSFSKKQGFNN